MFQSATHSPYPPARWLSVITILFYAGLPPLASGSPQADQAAGAIEALKNPDARARYEAAITLGKLKDARAIEPLIVTLKDADSFVRLQAAGALGKLGEPAIFPLIGALKDPDVNARRAAAYALGEIKGTRVVDPLIAALKDVNRLVRRDAAEALARISHRILLRSWQ